MNYYRYSYCLVAILCFVLRPLNAQGTNFKPAYYLTSQGDTINTSISQDGDLFLSKLISVKTASGEIKEVRPTEIAGFGFPRQNLHYQRVFHTFETEEGQETEVPRFARRLVSGFYDLYRLEQFPGEYVRELSNAPSHTYYLKDQEGGIFKLEQIEERITETQFRIVDKYKGVLKYLLQDWSELKQDVEGLYFTDAEIAGLIGRYNEVREPGSVKETIGGKVSVRGGRVGLRLSLPLLAMGERQTVQNGFGASLSCRLSDSRISNAAVFNVGLGYFQSNFGPGNSGVLELGGESISAITLPFSVDYILSRKGKFRPKVRALFMPSITEVKRLVISRQNPGMMRESLNIEETVSSPVLYYGLGIGVEVANFEVNLQIERSQFAAFSDDNVEFNAITLALISLGVEYTLGRKAP